MSFLLVEIEQKSRINAFLVEEDRKKGKISLIVQ